MLISTLLVRDSLIPAINGKVVRLLHRLESIHSTQDFSLKYYCGFGSNRRRV